MHDKKMVFIIIFLIFSITTVFSQGRQYEGPDDPAGDIAAERAGFMTGNRVLIYYKNTTELSMCCNMGWDPSKWPNDFSGSVMLDGVATIVGARVYVDNDSIPVENPVDGGDYDTLYFMQSSFRQHMDRDPTGTIEWGLYPVFGYFNETSETPAMSNLPDSWPLLGWPSRGGDTKWPGEWNGRFGRGVMKADQECFFVVNDAQDQEYLEFDDTVKYYSRPGVFIGDKKPDVTIQKGLPWGGLGIRCELRGFQWSNPAAQDAIFWEYNISNISDYTIPEVLFGYYIMIGVGGECCDTGDDLAYHIKELNMYYAWDFDGIPEGGGKEPGVLGIAYLETPGLSYDNVDNDNDGLIDEKRDNLAVSIIGPTDGIADLDAFKSFYNLEDSDLKEHWDADEDQDWNDGMDLDSNGVYTEGEDPGDDLGLDGVGPYDLNYEGPDADGTECNHKPDMLEGLGAEPNFGITDVSETDMLGLTTFRYHFNWSTGSEIMSQDEKMFKFMSSGILEEEYLVPSNFRQQIASGLFPLYKGLTERISMSEFHTYENLAGLNSSQHKAPALFRLKEIVQLIYETDYRFAQPPLMPTLTTRPADGKVYLSWDDRSDKYTRDAFAKNANDFEGYKIYRSTDPYISDPMLISDGFGNPQMRKPIYQCDIIDEIEGFADFGEINGIEYYLGDESGITHSFIDNTVVNGKTYYYVLVAYDYGLPEIGNGIPPSENSIVLELDENENIRRIGPNVAVVKPHQMAAGVPEQGYTIDDELTSWMAKKMPVEIQIFNREQIKKGHTYKLKFNSNDLNYVQTNERYRSHYDGLFVSDEILLYDVTLNDSLVYRETKFDLNGSHFDSSYFSIQGSEIWYDHLTIEREIFTELVDGMRLKFEMPTIFAEVDNESTGWIVGDSKVRFHLAQEPPNKSSQALDQNWKHFPWHYEIVWTGDPSAYTTRTDFPVNITDHNKEYLSRSDLLLNQSFDFFVRNKSFIDSTGSYPLMDLLVYDVNGNQEYDRESDFILVGDVVYDTRIKANRWGGTIMAIDFSSIVDESEMPKPNDVYQMDFIRPFHPEVDSLIFTITGSQDFDEAKLKTDMEKIRVVPNPYVVTNSMEEAVANWQRNQRRQIMFTHIPAQCKITIFTISGILIDEIDVDNSIENRKNSWDLNSTANGTVHWDLRSSEGLEIAAGYYIYHVESKVTGDVKVGKFAVIK